MEQKSPFASPAERRAAMRHLMLTDHGFLRVFWRHEHEIASGVWRSNQPSPRRIAAWAARGIKSVLLLRGQGRRRPLYLLEDETCTRHGLTLYRAPITGGTLASRDHVLALLDTFKIIEKPFVMHCKSGIDRTGLAAFLYLVAETDTPPEEARAQLSFKYLHVKATRHGVLDVMADAYLNAHRQTGIALRDWVENDYDPGALTAHYTGARPA
ncbi:MAG: fused DSP-PTPase phosphatase/NAD kinase-like protein [Paracoccaceae bacterium]